jgi:hypothetical protein
MVTMVVILIDRSLENMVLHLTKNIIYGELRLESIFTNWRNHN